MANEILKRDQNHITVLAGVTNDADQDVTMLRVDPITKRLLVAATGGGGGGTVDSVVAGDAIDVDDTDPANPVVSVADNGVTNAKLANMATKTFKGRTSSGTGDPEDLTLTQARALLAFAGLVSINTANSTAIDNTTSETEFNLTTSLPNVNTAARTYLVIATGFLSTTGTPTLTIRLKGDATKTTTLWDSGAQTMGSSVSNRPWMCVWVITTRATGGSGSLHTSVVYNRFDARSSNQAATDNTVDLGLGSALAITAQWSAASSSNTVTLDTFCVVDLNSR